jgi:hypothetical protein
MQIHKFYLLLLFLSLLLPAVSMAQTPDTLYVFRFVSHKNMFYIPWKGNGTQLDHLLSLVENHKAAILSGEVPLLVDGYCVSEPTVAESLKLAKIRSNRVKSELILSKGIDENCFITRNHAETYGGFVPCGHRSSSFTPKWDGGKCKRGFCNIYNKGKGNGGYFGKF